MTAIDSSRRFAHDLVDLLFDHVERIDTLPAVEWKPEQELRELVRLGDAPADPLDLAKLVVRWSNQFHHPKRVMASDDFEAVHEPELNIFCFRKHGLNDLQTAELRERLVRSGKAWITTTVLRGQRVLRVTMMNPRTTEAHVDAMLDALREL